MANKVIIREVQSGYITTQRTAKKWKLLKVASYVPIVLGGLMMLTLNEQKGAFLSGAIIFAVGAFLNVFSKLGIWWNHS